MTNSITLIIRVTVLMLFSVAFPSAAHAWRLEAGQATANATFGGGGFTQVTFQNAFDLVPVVTVLSTSQGADPSSLRIRNVTVTGFEVAPLEPPGNDGAHVAMTFDYIAAEPGIHRLPSEETIIVGRHTTSSIQAGGNVTGPRAFDTVPFGATIAGGATVIATIQTDNSETGAVPSAPFMPWLSVAARNAGTTSVQLALERSEVAAGTVQPETIGYIAFPSGGTGTFGDINDVATDWSAVTSTNSIPGIACTTATFSTTPFAAARVVASKATRIGADGGWLRRCSLDATTIGLFNEEDVANDPERGHVAEAASILAFSRSFHAFFGPELIVNKTVAIVADPVNGPSGAFAIPGAQLRYTLDVANTAGTPVDADTFNLVDMLPPDIELIVSDPAAPGQGPITFADGTPSSGLAYTFTSLGDTNDDVAFSNDGGLTFAYTPTPNGRGTDPAITHFQLTPTGAFQGGSAATPPSAQFTYDVVLK